MRWVSVIVMLAWMMQAPLADIAYGKPVESKGNPEPCGAQTEGNGKPVSSSWAPRIGTETALTVIRQCAACMCDHRSHDCHSGRAAGPADSLDRERAP
jgi:hypothetical protein